MRIQISFLGRARQDPRTGYRSARYRFEDGAVAETAFSGTALARRAFERGDYLRAAIYAQESVVSRTVGPGRVNDFPARNEARDRLRNEDPRVKALVHLRNAMAHGVSPTDPRSSRDLRDENTLRGALGSLLHDLLR